MPGHTARPGNQNYTQVCRLGSIEELPTQGSEAGRRFQSIFLRRVAREYDEIKFVLLTYKRSYSQSNQSSSPGCVNTPAFQTLCGVAREACMERILTQVPSDKCVDWNAVYLCPADECLLGRGLDGRGQSLAESG